LFVHHSQNTQKKEKQKLQAAKPLRRKSRTTAAEPQYQSSSQRPQTFFPCPFMSFLLLQTPLQSQNTTAKLLSRQRERQHTKEKPKKTHTQTHTQNKDEKQMSQMKTRQKQRQEVIYKRSAWCT
jgi:hypothetical protein